MTSSTPSSSASTSSSTSPGTPRDVAHLFASRLKPPPRVPPLRLKASFPSQPRTIPEHLAYPSVFTRPFADPHETLCTVYGVHRVDLEVPLGSALPDTVDMPRLAPPRAGGAGPSVDARSAPTPTHVLAVLEVPTPSTTTDALRPLLVPVDAELLAACFKNDFVRSLQWPAVPTANAPPPPPSPEAEAEPAPADVLRLPLRPLYVPHPPSVPLLLLFGFGDEFLAQCAAAEAALRAPDTPPSPMSPRSPTSDSTASITPTQSPTRTVSGETRSPTASRPDTRRRASSSATLTPATTPASAPLSPPQSPTRADALCTGLLATYLLPLAAIEEFPATPAMAQQCSHSRDVGDGAAFAGGLWRNVLLLAPREQAVIEIVGTAMRVAWEAGRVQGWEREQREGEWELALERSKRR